MTPAERLLTDLRVANVRVRVDGDLVRCKTADGSPLPTDLAVAIREHKPALLALLRAEEAEITWRVERIGRWLHVPAEDLMPGVCSFCGLAMPGSQTGKCVLCCLASVELLERKRQTPYPSSDGLPVDSGTEQGSWDMTTEHDERNAA